jgi:hypothetical protein
MARTSGQTGQLYDSQRLAANEGNYTVVVSKLPGWSRAPSNAYRARAANDRFAANKSQTITNGSSAIHGRRHRTMPLGYQWRFNGANLIGQTASSITIFNASTANDGNYTVVVSNIAGMVTSVVARLTVLVPR